MSQRQARISNGANNPSATIGQRRKVWKMSYKKDQPEWSVEPFATANKWFFSLEQTWTMSREEALASEDEDSEEEDEEDLVPISAPSFINVYAARFATG